MEGGGKPTEQQPKWYIYEAPRGSGYMTNYMIFGFYVGMEEGIVLVRLPLWFTAIAPLLIAIASWLPWRFSLHTLLIATTVVAVGLGLIVWLASAR